MLKQVFSVLLLLTSNTAVQAYDFATAADKHIVPAYQHLLDTTARLDSAAHAYCKTATEQGMQNVRTAWREGFLAWQGAQHLRFGPVQYLLREHRYAFWPDKRGTVSKHMRKLLNDPALLQDGFEISQTSAAVQGFSALERLLFTDATPDAKACALIIAIAGNLHGMSNGLKKDWVSGDDPYRQYFIKPAEDNPFFESDEELAGQLLNGLHTQLELIVTQKLARPLGDKFASARGKRAEAWRSQSALPAIRANLLAIEGLYQQVFAIKLANKPLRHKIDLAFHQANATLNNIVLPLSVAVSDADRRAMVERLQGDASKLKGLIASELTTALGLSLGFNSLDGD